jgi:fatty-acyl-CoA synthase
MLTHQDSLRRTASSYGQRTAILDADGHGITYRQLDEQTDRVAGALLRLGLERGERVVWVSKNTTKFALAYFGTAKANLAFSAFNYWLRPDELRLLVELLEPSVFIASDEYADVVEDLSIAGRRRHLVSLGDGPRPGWTPFSSLLDLPLPTGGLPAGEETLLHEIVFTSGTTGQSKGVMRSQRKRIIDSAMAALAFELTRNDHGMSFGPQFHIGGMSGPNQLLLQGGTVSMLQFDPETAARAISRGVTYMTGVPAHYNLLFEEKALEGIDTSAVRGCYVGGSVATKELFGLIGEHFPNAELVHGYGSTESGPHTMALRGQEFTEHYGSLGLPVPGNEVRLVDKDSNDVPTGEIGELLVRSDTVMDGYYRREELTRGALTADGWLYTGDLLRKDPEGYFHLAGRAKELIISGGENVYPKEVEDLISELPAVAEVAVIGIPDPVYEERVVALIRLSPGGVAPTAEDVIAFVRSRLAGFKTPKEVHIVDDFPRTGVGKIAKPELRQQYGSVFEELP